MPSRRDRIRTMRLTSQPYVAQLVLSRSTELGACLFLARRRVSLIEVSYLSSKTRLSARAARCPQEPAAETAYLHYYRLKSIPDVASASDNHSKQ